MWMDVALQIVAVVEGPARDPAAVVTGCLDAMMRDPVGAQILVREIVDGAPFLAEVAARDPNVLQAAQRTAAAIATFRAKAHLRSGIDPMLAILIVAGVAAFVASAQTAASAHLTPPIPVQRWRRNVTALLLHGLVPPAK
jgi:TetR/AcrR family transcriptional regulator